MVLSLGPPQHHRRIFLSQVSPHLSPPCNLHAHESTPRCDTVSQPRPVDLDLDLDLGSVLNLVPPEVFRSPIDSAYSVLVLRFCLS